MIRIFQMHCNFSELSKDKQRPEWFNREKIFDSFIRTLNSSVSYLAVHDSGNGKIEDHFINNKDVENISMVGGNGAKAFLNLLNYVKEQKFHEDDIIYFVEDDYLHKKGWIDILREGFDLINADYYTLYDHPDKYYNPGYENLQSKLIATKSAHWRTTPSTTNTFACRYSTLMKHFDIHVNFCDVNAGWVKDHDKFTTLWQRGSNLLSCIPGYSTHVESNMLSPIINWRTL